MENAFVSLITLRLYLFYLLMNFIEFLLSQSCLIFWFFSFVKVTCGEITTFQRRAVKVELRSFRLQSEKASSDLRITQSFVVELKGNVS